MMQTTVATLCKQAIFLLMILTHLACADSGEDVTFSGDAVADGVTTGEEPSDGEIRRADSFVAAAEDTELSDVNTGEEAGFDDTDAGIEDTVDDAKVPDTAQDGSSPAGDTMADVAVGSEMSDGNTRADVETAKGDTAQGSDAGDTTGEDQDVDVVDVTDVTEAADVADVVDAADVAEDGDTIGEEDSGKTDVTLLQDSGEVDGVDDEEDTTANDIAEDALGDDGITGDESDTVEDTTVPDESIEKNGCAENCESVTITEAGCYCDASCDNFGDCCDDACSECGNGCVEPLLESCPEGLTYEGCCNGNVLTWCEEAVVKTLYCSLGCGVWLEAGFYECIQNEGVEPSEEDTGAFPLVCDWAEESGEEGGPVSCEADSDCTDGLACNGEELCEEGLCSAGVSVACDDGNSCTADVCTEEQGCVFSVVAGGTCDDGDPCTEGDTCISGSCLGSPATCNDGDDCTTDSCGPQGCVNEAIPGCGGEEGGTEDPGDVVLWSELENALQSDCAPCHFGGNQSTFTPFYVEANWEYMIVRINSVSNPMPPSFAGAADPALDDLIEQWVLDGANE